MMNKFVKWFSSFRMSVVLLVVYAMLLAVATWVEKYWGTPVAGRWIYRSPFLLFLQLLLVANFLLYAGKHQYLSKNRLGLMFTHLSFIVILTGAVITHFWGEEGILHLREGESAASMMVRNADGQYAEQKLPFSVRLNDFVLKRYPGSGSPSSYESFVTVHTQAKEYDAHIYMNNVLDVEGYRLYQASFDSDERGSVLSVNHDVAGRNVTYTGYVLLLFGLILSLVGRDGRFRRLFRRLKTMQAGRASLLLLFLGGGLALNAAPDDAWQMIEASIVADMIMSFRSGRMISCVCRASANARSELMLRS